MTPDISARQRWVAVGLVASVGAAALLAPLLERPTLRIAIHQGVEGVALQAMARQFSNDKNVDVEVFELPYDALYEAEMKALVAEHPPYDVIMLDDPWLPALIGEDGVNESTRLRRLQFTVDDCAKLRLDDFVASTLRVSLHPLDPKAPGSAPEPDSAASFSCEGATDALYALPFVGNSQLFITRRNQHRPQSWREVLQITIDSAMTDAGYVARVGAGNSIVTDFLPVLWTLSKGGDAVSQASAPEARIAEHLLAVKEPQAIAAFEFLQALGAHPRANRGVVSADDFDLTINLVKKNASMAIAWSAWVMAIAKLPPPYNQRLVSENGELQIGQVPGGEPVLGAWLLAIPARSERTVLAQQFLVFATEPPNIVEAARRGNPPPRKSVLSDKDLRLLYPFFDEQLKSLTIARARPRTPHWRDIERVLGECLTTLYENATSPKEAWDRVNEGLQPIRDKETRIQKEQSNRQKIRTILDEPLSEFSCQRQVPRQTGTVATHTGTNP